MGNELRVRIYPDQLAVETHEHELNRHEVESGRKFRQAYDTADDDTARRDAWRALAKEFGPARASWIARQIDIYDSYEESDLDKLAYEAWTTPPTVRTLPDQFLVTVYAKHQALPPVVGKPIPRELPLTRGPQNGEDFEDGLFDKAASWVADFDEAVKVGMAVRIPISDDQLPFTRVTAVGLQKSLSPGRAAKLVEDWIDGQHYTEGFEFLPYGTPTNNTGLTKSGHSETAEDPDDSYPDEIVGTQDRALDPIHSNGGRFRLALGLPEGSDVFAHTRLASATGDAWAGHAQTILWAATGGYFLDTMLGNVVPPDDQARVTKHFSRFVRGAGPFAALRIGNHPYGVLPVTRLAASSQDDPNGWTPSPSDSRTLDGNSQDWSRFDRGLHNVAWQLFTKWEKLATRDQPSDESSGIPRIGTSDDPDGEILRTLSMEPRSTSYQLRPFVDERFVASLLGLLRYRFWSPRETGKGVQKWVDAWTDRRKAMVRTLTTLGAGRPAADAAPLTRILGWGDGWDFAGAVVDENWGQSLRLLCENGPETAPPGGDSLLYAMLRQAVRLAPELRSEICNLAGAEVIEFFNRAATPDEVVRRVVDDPDFGKASPLAYGVRPRLAERILSERDKLPGGRFTKIDEIDTVFGIGPDTLHDIVSSFPGPKLVDVDGLFRHALDLCTHRLDAWLTSLATKRLEGMRASKPTGLHIGAYGWVEGTLDKASSGGGDGGYIHAPSLGQAAAGALLRNAYLTHDGNGTNGENPFGIDLRSERVALALHLLDGIRQGQPLGALLGYQFERALHEANLDRYIDDFRSAFPLVAGKEVEPTGAEESEEAVAARNVVDGMALAEAHRTGEIDVAAMVAVQDGNENAEARATLDLELQRLRDALDAVGDLLLTEGVFQSAEGNVERAGAALDAAAGNGRPPEIESVRTRVSGSGLRHRVCLLFPAADGATNSGPRTKAEPRLAAWVANLMGDLSKVRFGPQGDNEAGLDELGLEPIDLLYMSSLPPRGEETDLDRLLRNHLRKHSDLTPEETADLRLNIKDGVNDLLDVARSLLGLVTDGSVLRPEALVRPEEADSLTFSDASVQDFDARVMSARGRLRERVVKKLEEDAPVDDKQIRQALLEALRFGIPGAAPTSPTETGPDLDTRRGNVYAEAKTRFDRCTKLRAEALADDLADKPALKVEKLQEAMKALFGPSFVVLPKFEAPQADVLGAAVTQNGRLPEEAEDRLYLWLQQAAETRRAVRRLEDALMVTEVWSQRQDGHAPLKLQVAQLPFCEGRPWQALSDHEIENLSGDTTGATGECAEPAEGRPRAVLSLVAVAPREWEPNWDEVAGLLVDEWTETIPLDDVSTGISFQYDAPNSQAPQALLLAVPGRFEKNGKWSVEKLRDIVNDTLDLAKVRLVDPDALRELGGVLPALFAPVDAANPGWKRAQKAPTLEAVRKAFREEG